MTALGFLQVLWRRKWFILVIVLMVPAVAFFESRNQPAQYEASSQVLLSYRDLAGSLTGTDNIGSSVFQDPARIAETQAQLARVPGVAEKVVAAHPEFGLTPDQFLGMSSASSESDADILVFSVKDRDPARATTLATEYGRQFTAYRQQLDTASIASARKDVSDRLAQLERDGQRGTSLYQSLQAKEESLRTVEALQTSNAFLVRPASGAGKVSPKPVRNAAFGLVFGLILAGALVALIEALDTRCRNADEIGGILGMTLLGRLPGPPRKLRKDSLAAMHFDPGGLQAEAFRTLRTNIEFVDLEGRTKSILITSALEGEGKTTTAVNLAVAFVRSGKSVALVDLDLRRPRVARFFVDVVPEWVDLSQQPGVTDIAVGKSTLGEAVLSTPVLTERSALKADREGTLDVVVSGAIPPNPGEIVGSTRIGEALAELRATHDVVIIDTPPVLAVSDAVSVSRHVDGIILIVRTETARRRPLREVLRALEAAPARKLGYVVTGDAARAGYETYGYSDQGQGESRRKARKRAKAAASGGARDQ